MSSNQEDFCMACITAPLALAGVGGAAASSGDKKKKDKTKKIIFWVSITLTVISILLTIYFLFWKNCEECK